jgi:hypothetical protein
MVKGTLTDRMRNRAIKAASGVGLAVTLAACAAMSPDSFSHPDKSPLEVKAAITYCEGQIEKKYGSREEEVTKGMFMIPVNLTAAVVGSPSSMDPDSVIDHVNLSAYDNAVASCMEKLGYTRE